MVNNTKKLKAQKSFSQEAYLGSYPYNLIKSGNLDKFYKILTNFNFIETKIQHPKFGVQALIEDYALIDDIDNTELLTYPEYNVESTRALKLIQDALRLSAHIINEDKTQLAGQLLGRLQCFDTPKVQELLYLVRQYKSALWLRPLTSRLNRPGGILFRTFTGICSGEKVFAVTSDSKQIICTSLDNNLIVYNINTGESDFRTINNKEKVLAVITDNNENLVISALDDTIKIWNLKTKESFLDLPVNSLQVNAATITPDRTRLIFALDTKAIQVRNLRTGVLEFELSLKGYKGNVIKLVVIPDNKRLIAAIDSGIIIVWDLQSKRILFTQKDYNCISNAITVTPDSKWLIYGSIRNEEYNNYYNLIKCNIETRREILANFIKLLTKSERSIKTGKRILQIIENLINIKQELSLTNNLSSITTAVDVSLDGNWLISANYTLDIQNLKTNQKLPPFHNEDGVEGIAVTPNGRQIIFVSHNKTIKVCNLGIVDSTLPLTEHRDRVKVLAVTANNKWLYSGAGNVLKQWNLETQELFNSSNLQENVSPFPTLEREATIETISLTPNGKLITAHQDKTLKVWDVKKEDDHLLLKSLRQDFYDYINKINIFKNDTFIYIRAIIYFYVSLMFAVTFTINNQLFFIFIVLYLLFIICFNIVFENNKNIVISLAVTLDSERVVAGSRDKTIRVWNIKNRKRLFTLRGHKDWVNAVAVTSNGKRVISSSLDQTIKVWNLESGKEVFTLNDNSDSPQGKGDSNQINAIAITPDNEWLICALKTNSIKVWNLMERKTFIIQAHNDSVNSVVITNDGTKFISCSNDQTLKVWDLSNWKVVATYTAESALTCCTVAPDGLKIIAGDASGRLHFLRLEGTEVEL